MLIYCFLCAVPSEYYAQLDATGKRVDLNQRPELTKGTVEFVAPAEYMVRPPMPPVYFFLIDVSISAVRSGMIEVSTSLLAQCIA
jgi:protein transport protein SEC24